MYTGLLKLTDAGGCGCKTPSAVLSEILFGDHDDFKDPNLLIGYKSMEDASVYQTGVDECLINSLDFFTPIVDDPYIYGQISAANAISDIYAMGGMPFWSLSILGFPSKIVPANIIKDILAGARDICNKARIVIGGGHTIENPQPIFGLSVLGKATPSTIKYNKSAKVGDLIYLTKPIGTGILITANKLDKADPSHFLRAINSMTTLNEAGIAFGKLSYVNAMTDVTGFGLLGHLFEVCNASQVSVELQYNSIKVFDGVERHIADSIITTGGKNNWKAYSDQIESTVKINEWILSDPQTNGGLLVTVAPKFKNEFEKELAALGLKEFSNPIGTIIKQKKLKKITVT